MYLGGKETKLLKFRTIEERPHEHGTRISEERGLMNLVLLELHNYKLDFHTDRECTSDGVRNLQG